MNIGKWGERRAAAYLRENGFAILRTNFRSRQGEIDIVAREKDVTVFVEVKTRGDRQLGLPCEAVNAHKRKQLVRMAEIFIGMTHADPEAAYRFDVVEILRLDGKSWIRHIRDAFWL